MRLVSSVLTVAALLCARSSYGAGPCVPRPPLPLHSPAFASGVSAEAAPSPSARYYAGGAADELRIQTECLAWEARVLPRAEFLDPMPIRPGVPPGPAPDSPADPPPSSAWTPRVTVSRIPVGPPQQSPFEPARGFTAFRLGLDLSPSR